MELASTVWVNLGLGMVDAELTDTHEPLPRIPPLRGHLSVDIPYREFTISPEWTIAAAQGRVFRNETQTEGYSVFNLKASYVWPMQHMVHILSVTGYNLSDELYRSHTSFIKNLAPEENLRSGLIFIDDQSGRLYIREFKMRSSLSLS